MPTEKTLFIMHIKILPVAFPIFFSAIMFRLIKHYSPKVLQYWRFNITETSQCSILMFNVEHNAVTLLYIVF